jgi:hypothetical protein
MTIATTTAATAKPSQIQTTERDVPDRVGCARRSAARLTVRGF